MAVKVLSQIVFDVPRHVDQRAALQKQEEAADDACADNQDDRAKQLVIAHTGGSQIVDRQTDKARDEDSESHRAQDVESPDEQRDAILLQIMTQPGAACWK